MLHGPSKDPSGSVRRHGTDLLANVTAFAVHWGERGYASGTIQPIGRGAGREARGEGGCSVVLAAGMAGSDGGPTVELD